jgi:hypothetical protein
MQHIFGYTVADFSYDQGISESLKLDYFVLASISKELGYQGDSSVFILCVMNNNVMQNVISAASKYEYKGEVEFRFVNPDVSDFKVYMNMLHDSVTDFGSKLVIPAADTPEKKKKMILFAHKVGRRCLSRQIKIQYPKIKEVKDKYLQPSGLNWDFYGVLE